MHDQGNRNIPARLSSLAGLASHGQNERCRSLARRAGFNLQSGSRKLLLQSRPLQFHRCLLSLLALGRVRQFGAKFGDMLRDVCLHIDLLFLENRVSPQCRSERVRDCAATAGGGERGNRFLRSKNWRDRSSLRRLTGMVQSET